MKLTEVRSGLANTVSPDRITPLPSAPSAQWMTALPGKWPPGWMTVIPGNGLSLPDHVSITGSCRATHSASASETYTGTPPSR
jgi:hypothetical protein